MRDKEKKEKKKDRKEHKQEEKGNIFLSLYRSFVEMEGIHRPLGLTPQHSMDER